MSRTLFAAVVAVSSLVVVPASRAQVAAFDWSFEYTPFEGWIVQQPESFDVSGPNNDDEVQFGGSSAWVSTVAPADAHVSVTAEFQNLDWDWHFDAPVAFVNGVIQFPFPEPFHLYPSGTYVLEFDVAEGDSFGFGVWSADNAEGPGVADFHDLQFVPVTWTDAGHALDPREWLHIAPPAGTSDFGASLGALGDLDGDGHPDVAVGAPASGRVLVHSGADGAVLLDITGGSGFGEVVRGAGDVNGDGRPDLLVGLPKADTAGTDSGRIEVRSGADGSLLFAVDGDAANAVLGTAVAAAGDVTGDGLADVIVGAPRQFPATAAGYALLLAGPSGALIHRFDGSATSFGAAVCGLGDANGDAVPDVVVAEPSFGNLGAARVFSGATFAPLASATHGGPAQAASLARLGDVDGDGRADFAWGHTASDVFTYGFVLVVSGATGATLTQIAGHDPFDTLGFAVAGGDFDGDGEPDLAFQSRHSADAFGRVRVASGGSGFAVIHDLRAGPGDAFGVALDAVGDLDGDGASDLAIGAPGAGLGLQLVHALDGNGVPRLSGSGDLAPGSHFSLSLQDARAFAPSVLVVSPTRVDLPAKGGVLVPFPTLVIPVSTNAAGAFTLSGHWPPAIPSGFTLWMQAWVGDADGPSGFSASNGLGGLTP